MTYLTFGLLALVAFYMWRFTVWAHDAGGYWNLVTGQRAAAAPPSTADPNEIARLASQAREREMKGNVDRNGKPRKGKKEVSLECVWGVNECGVCFLSRSCLTLTSLSLSEM